MAEFRNNPELVVRRAYELDRSRPAEQVLRRARRNRAPKGLRLSEKELNELLGDECPRLATCKQMAKALNLTEGTLRQYLSKGHFDGCVKKGRPVRFHRNRAARRFLSNWRNS